MRECRATVPQRVQGEYAYGEALQHVALALGWTPEVERHRERQSEVLQCFARVERFRGVLGLPRTRRRQQRFLNQMGRGADEQPHEAG